MAAWAKVLLPTENYAKYSHIKASKLVCCESVFIAIVVFDCLLYGQDYTLKLANLKR